ncbi:MAG: glycosyltransferase [Nitrospinales bacterium]
MNNSALNDQTIDTNLSDIPTVSLVMFTYNRIEYTREALDTLIKNTDYPFDLYIVDNYSTDGTREWLETFRLEYPDRIKDIRFNPTNEGLPGPTNDFWSRVDSELIGKVDNDTLVPPGWLERLVEAHQKIPELAVVGGYHFQPEDFDDNSARSRLYAHNGIKILPDMHIGGCCYLMKKSIQKVFGPMKFNPALKIHGWTEYQHMLAGAGYIVGYLYPIIQLEYMDDPRSKKCLINEKYQDYSRKIWRERGIKFKSTDQVVEWLHRDAQRITNQPSSGASSFKGKNQQTNKSYYGYARPEIQALVSLKAKKILDIGCGAGVFGKELKNRQKCYVAGIEYAPRAVTRAETVLDKFYKGDAAKIMPVILENSFDTIIMADFLEHIAHPEKILSEVKRILIPGGRLVLSIPNVRHWSVIKDLLEGRWEYRDAGILDKTHLRFFTWQSILSLLNSAGYQIDSYSGTYLQGYDVPVEFINLSKQCGIDTSSLASEGRIYQYLITCIPKSGDESSKIMVQKQTVPENQFTSIIILTHNQLEYTKRCIKSIFKHTKETFELILVDNGSTDGTVEYLESEVIAQNTKVKGQKSEIRIKIIKNKENLGFAAGNNQGMTVARGQYILLLNNDVVVTPGWLDRMIVSLERHPQIGIVGPRSNYVSGPQLVSSISYNVDTLKGLTGYSENFAAEHKNEATRILRVVGFCMLIKRSVIEKIGGMDERYGLGNFEDDDFSLRAALAGFESWMAEDCFIHHFGSRTFAGAKIDFSKSLQRNWIVFKKKWELPDELPYGSPYSLSEMPIDGFDPARHYCRLSSNENYANDEMTAASISVEKIYLNIQKQMNISSPEETIGRLESLLASYPDFAIAYNDLGVLYYNFGNKEKAVNYYQKAVGIEPGNITFQKNLADFLYVESGMVEEALQIFVKILTICPEDIETLLITGHICVAIKKFDDAEEFYNRVLEIDPRNEGAGQNLVALKKYIANIENQLSGESQTFLDSKKASDIIGGNQPDDLQSKRCDYRPSVSIIISLEGLQNCLEDCLKCIEQYTSESYEIIFLNNGATKAVLKWTQRMVAEYHNYRLLNIGKNIGWAECINRGIRDSAGELIVILHNDVVVCEAWLSDMLECINRDSKIGLVGPMTNQAVGIQKDINTNYRSIDHFETYAKKFRKRNRYRRVRLKNISEICIIFRRELIEEIGYFDENLKTEAVAVEDFCSRIAMRGYENVVAADVYIHHYDRHNTKMNGSETEQKKVEDRKVFKEKFTGLEMKSPVSEKFQALKILEQADELNQKDQLDQALDTLLSGIGMGPDEQKYYLTLAEILLNSGRFKDALDALREMPEKEEAGAATHQKIRKYELLGYCEDGLGRHREAEEYTEHVLSLNPSSESALNLKGILAFKHNNKKAAEEFFKKAIKSDPGYGEPYTNLGTLKWEEGQEKDALRLYEKGFILTPTDLDIATIYHSAISTLDEFERAHSVVLDAAAMHPHNKKIQYLFIDILIQLGKYDRAMSEIEAAIVKFGHNDGILSAALKIRELLGPNQISETQRRTAVSLCMIVKNEEQYLAHCLASVKPIVDEMIVVDTGSTDSTKDIAVSFGAMIYDYDWNDNFAEARNFSISKASGNWILIMDADEVISHLDYTKFKEIVKVPHKNPAAYSIITRNYCTLANTIGWVANDGKYFQEEAGIGWIPSVKVRLFYGKDLICFEGVVHELLDPVLKRKGIKTEPCGIPVHHYGRLNRDNLDRKGEIYFEIGKKKLEEMGDDLNALRELAIQATIIGKNKDAIELWERLLALKPDPKFCAEVFINMGTVYSRMGKYQDALYASKMATAHSPELKEAIYNYAMAELHLGNAGKTIEVLEEMLTKVPEYPPAQFVLVAAYACQGSKERALEGLRKLKSAKMGSVFVFSCVELAKGLISADQIDYAISLLSAAIESEIVNADLLNIFKECLNIKKRAETFDDINTQLSIFANQKNKLKCAAGDVSLTY